jgi:hypothetical protein
MNSKLFIQVFLIKKKILKFQKNYRISTKMKTWSKFKKRMKVKTLIPNSVVMKNSKKLNKNSIKSLLIPLKIINKMNEFPKKFIFFDF